MEKEVAKALNNISKRLFEVERQLDNYFNNRCDENKNDIADTQDALCENSLVAEDKVAELEDAICELSEIIESEDM